MAAFKKVKFHSDVVDYFKELSFYNMHIEKPKMHFWKTLICFQNFLAFWTERITREDKKLATDLDCYQFWFPVQEKDFSKIEKRSNICINVYCYENRLTFLIYVPDQRFENSMDLSLVTNENKSHYVYIKDFKRFTFLKTKNKNEK